MRCGECHSHAGHVPRCESRAGFVHRYHHRRPDPNPAQDSRSQAVGCPARGVPCVSRAENAFRSRSMPAASPRSIPRGIRARCTQDDVPAPFVESRAVLAHRRHFHRRFGYFWESRAGFAYNIWHFPFSRRPVRFPRGKRMFTIFLPRFPRGAWFAV